MTNMTTTRLGVLPCPAVGYVGSGAKAAFGGGAAMRWREQHVSQVQSVVRTADPIFIDNSTGVSAPPERSP